ncbi:MAG: carbohydrate binding family 9 domain-containing protein, partial [Acidobacteriaceae bacterium]
MQRRFFTQFSLLLVSLLIGGTARAAGVADAGAMPAKPRGAGVSPVRQAGVVRIPRLAMEPKLSDFLTPETEEAGRMLRVDSFVERYPEDGSRPSENTVAYLGYTHDAFFAAFVCTDTTPALIRSHMLARDAPGDDDDVFLMLDTFHDQRRAFFFQSNPLGIESDALYSEQTGYDFSFDTVWDTWGKRTPRGYVVLFRIPFASLYFAKADPGEMRTWGMILGRNISHTNESDYWPRMNHDIAGRLTQETEVEGFSDIERGQNVQLQPYSLGR